MIVRVEIPGEPVGQGRPRAAVINGHARIYSPKTSGDWRGRAAVFMRQACPEPVQGPVRVDVTAVFGLPASKHRKRSPEVNQTPCTKRPDIDNVVKAVLDAGNGILWGDDAQVWKLDITKVYGAQGEAARVLVQVIA